MKYFKTLLLLLIAFSSYGQSYVLTTSGDSLVGKFSILKNSVGNEYISMRVGIEKKEINALQIRQMSDKKGNIYEPIEAEGRYKLGLKKVTGYASLYSYTTKNSAQSFNQEIIVKLDGTSLVVPGFIEFRKVLSSFLFECQDVSMKILDKGYYKRKDLALMITDFNVCMENQNPENLLYNTDLSQDGTTVLSLYERFKNQITISPNIKNKNDVLAMFNDISQKLSSGQNVPNYLKNAFRSSIASDKDLISLYKELFEDN